MSGLQRGYYYGSLCLSSSPYALLVDGDSGAPEKILQSTAQQLQDGEIVTSPRSSNRSMTWQVLIEASDLQTMAEYEAALIAEAERERNTWRIVAGDDVAPDTVFDTFSATARCVPHEEWEEPIPEGYRLWELTIPASPFGRSASTQVTSVVIATTAAPSTDTIDDCTSLTDWTGSPTPTLSSGGIQVYPPSGPYDSTIEMWAKRSGLSYSMATRRYLRVEYSGTRIGSVTWLANGDVVRPVGMGRVGFRWALWFDLLGQTINSFEARTLGTYSASARPNLTLWDLSASTQPVDAATTGRQGRRQIAVAGSMRTQGSLAIAAARGLGTLLVYTRPVSDQPIAAPNLRPWRTGGSTVTTDPATVSGGRNAMSTPITFALPVDAVSPGAHVLIARLRAGSTGSHDLTWKTRYSLGGPTVDVETGGISESFTDGVWRTVVLGHVTLPPHDGGSIMQMIIQLSSATLELDELWAFNLDRGQLSWIECGEGAAASGYACSMAWLNAASLDRPAPSAWIGSNSDLSNSTWAGEAMRSFGVHEFKPPTVDAFVATTLDTAGDDVTATLAHVPTWHTWAAS